MDAALPAAEVAELLTIIEGPLGGSGRILDLRTRKSGAQRFVEVTVGLPAAMTVGASHRICDEIEAAIHRRHAPPPKVVVHLEPTEN